MKKLFIMLGLSISILASVHPNLSMKHIEVKGQEESSFLSDMIDIGRSEIIFEKTEDEYMVKLMSKDSEGYEMEHNIDSFEVGREIRSVFFYEVSGDSLREIFFITEYKGEQKIFAYGVSYEGWSFYYERLNPLMEKLNNKLIGAESIDTAMVKEELKGMLPLDITSLVWNQVDNQFYSGIDFLEGEVFGYFDSKGNRVEGIEESDYYIKSYGSNIYAKVKKLEGYSMVAVFEGREIEEKPFIIKHGRYSSDDGYFGMNGTYIEGEKHGEWEEAERMYHAYGRYDKGKKIGEWWINGMYGKLVDDLRDGLWTSEDGLNSIIYSMGEVIEERAYDYESGELISETIYGTGEDYTSKEFSYGELIALENYKDGRYYKEEYDTNGRLTYITTNERARIEMRDLENEKISKEFSDIDWKEIEYLGKLKIGSTIPYIDSYYLKNSSSWNYKSKVYKGRSGDKEVFIVTLQPRGEYTYMIGEVFEGYLTEDEFPKNIVRNGRSENYSYGIIKSNGKFVEGKVNGKWLFYSYYKVSKEINFHDGKWHGAFKEYDEDGALITHFIYDMGRKVEAKNDIDMEAALNEYFRMLVD